MADSAFNEHQNNLGKPPGRFISFEGGEGVGKSRLIEALSSYLLETYKVQAVTTREPGGTPEGNRIRSLFSGEPSQYPWLPISEALLVSAARAQHSHFVIAPAIKSGNWVLCDRFSDSTRVYQDGVDSKILESLIDLTTFGLTPHLTFLLDCPVDISLSRTKKRQKTTSIPSQPDSSSSRASQSAPEEILRFDQQSPEIHEIRRLKFLQLAQLFKDRFVIIDSSGDFNQVLNKAKQILADRFFP